MGGALGHSASGWVGAKSRVVYFPLTLAGSPLGEAAVTTPPKSPGSSANEADRVTGAGIGGAILGASLGGPPGAIIGGLLGILLAGVVIDEERKGGRGRRRPPRQ